MKKLLTLDLANISQIQPKEKNRKYLKKKKNNRTSLQFKTFGF